MGVMERRGQKKQNGVEGREEESSEGCKGERRDKGNRKE